MDITPEQAAVHDQLRSAIVGVKHAGRPFIAGITGVDTAGKTSFASDLGDCLSDRSIPVQLVHIDDFHHPRAYRYAGPDAAENYYTRSFDVQRLVRDVLLPIQTDGSLARELRLLDLETDSYVASRTFDVNRATVVLLEGVFLLRPEICPFLNFTILLDIPWDIALVRARERHLGACGGAAAVAKYSSKYLPAQRGHFEAVDPWSSADVVIDNSDWRRPRVVKGRGVLRRAPGTPQRS